MFSCGCPRRLAFQTVDSYIGQLQAILHDHLEATGTTITDTLTPNPAAHPSVKRYLKVMTEEQLSAGATPRQAELLFIGDLVALCKMTNDKLHTATIDPLHLYIHARDLAYFKLHLFSGDRPSDLAQIKAAESLRFPNDKGILFDHVLGKTLHSGDSRVFAVARHPNSAISPVQALDDYTPTCPSIKISLHSGPLLLLLAAALFFLMFSPQMLPKLGSRATWKLPDSPTRSFTVFAAVEPLPWHLLEALWTTLWNIWAGNLIA